MSLWLYTFGLNGGSPGQGASVVVVAEQLGQALRFAEQAVAANNANREALQLGGRITLDVDPESVVPFIGIGVVHIYDGER